MNSLLRSLGSKKVRYGSFSTLMIILVVAILVIINLVVGRLNFTFDMTANKTYTLSQESKDILAKIDQNITIYALVRTGTEDNMFSSKLGPLVCKELLQQYANNSKYISVVYEDPYLHPQFAVKYEQNGQALPDNTLIVESPKRHLVVNPNDLVTTNYDQQTYQPYYTNQIEPQVTNAINFVTADNTASIYTINSNGERPVPDNLKSQITLANFELKTFDVITQDIPKDCAILLLTQPSRDWTKAGADKVRAYLQNGGRAMFAIDYSSFSEMPNLSGVFQTYGCDLGKYVVVDGNANNYFDNPLTLLPNIAQHDITKNLLDGQYRVVLYPCSGIDTLSVKKNSIKIEPLLTTSQQSYGKTGADNSTTIQRQQNDASGPFNVAVAVTDSFYTDVQHTTKFVFVASSSIMDDTSNSYAGGANYIFVINSLNWLQDKSDTVYIPPKAPATSTQLQMSQGQAFGLMILSVFILPIAIIAIGLVVWLRRRYS